MNQIPPTSRRSEMSSTPAAVAGTLGRTPAPPASPTAQARATSRSVPREVAARYLWALTRLCMGWVFMWPFLDKMFGLGHETQSADAIIHGGNPTAGFLSGSVGPFSGIYHTIAGGWLVNVLFITGLFVIGAGLLLGIFMRVACASGALLVMLMWSATLPPQNDLFMDNHIIYALLLVGLALVGAGNTFGLGRRWGQTNLVQRHSWLA
jgi:thiosulfate dehydrogenase (quinone) large subunit